MTGFVVVLIIGALIGLSIFLAAACAHGRNKTWIPFDSDGYIGDEGRR